MMMMAPDEVSAFQPTTVPPLLPTVSSSSLFKTEHSWLMMKIWMYAPVGRFLPASILGSFKISRKPILELSAQIRA